MDSGRSENLEPNPASAATARVFWFLVTLHLGLWTLAPLISQPNATLDTVEMVLWGHEWQWGYYKHPPLPAWICEASVAMFGPVLWPMYLATQTLVVVCFWAVWRLAKQFLEPWPALAAAMLLEACTYYHYSSIDLNNNLPAKACWALAILVFHGCVTLNRKRDWLALGTAIGMGLLSKYDAALLAVPMIMFAAVHPRVRRVWQTPGPYISLATATVIFLPHLIWLVQNDFLTIQYLRNRSATESNWLNHVSHPAQFLVMQLAAVSAMLLLCVPLLGWQWKLKPLAGEKRFQRTLLITVVFGPLMIALIASAITGARLRSAWGSPMFTYLGLLLLVLFQSIGTQRTYRRVAFASAVVGAIFAALLMTINLSGPHLRGRGSRIHYPGQKLAYEVQRRWDAVSDHPLGIVAGDWWEAGNVAMYSEDRPSVFIGLSASYSPWTDDAELNEHGGVILWNAADDPDSPFSMDELTKRFPSLMAADPIDLPWNSSADIAPLRVGIGIVPGSRSNLPPTANESERVSNRPAIQVNDRR